MHIRMDGQTVIVMRDEEYIKNDSQLMFRLKQELNRLGFDAIKKPMWKDGHLTANSQYYVRSRKRTGASVYAIYDPSYMVRNLTKDFNRNGMVYLKYEIL